MSGQEVTQLLEGISRGEGQAAEALLPLVYDELRRLAKAQMGREQAGMTLQPTALVNEAYLRMVGEGSGRELKWDSRGHFFGAAARAMRHILVERARRRDRIRHGGGMAREPLESALASMDPVDLDMIGLDEALGLLESKSPRAYQVVMLRFFAGLGVEETALALGLGTTTVKAEWNYARAWLHRQMAGGA
jgi:RNA polymerase sigma factor (TIGR02999 family)